MISESVPKLSITMDMAFQKDLTLQGCKTLPTRANLLLMPLVKLSSLEGQQRVVDHDLYLAFIQTMSSLTVGSSTVMGPVPKLVPLIVHGGWFTRGRTSSNPSHVQNKV
jgi:hypothetical protein